MEGLKKLKTQGLGVPGREEDRPLGPLHTGEVGHQTGIFVLLVLVFLTRQLPSECWAEGERL